MGLYGREGGREGRDVPCEDGGGVGEGEVEGALIGGHGQEDRVPDESLREGER